MREKVLQSYRNHEEEIQGRIESFRELRKASDRRLFQELAFVVFTSQSRAKDCWKAVQELERTGLLLEGESSEVADVLARHEVSYEERKAGQLVENRRRLSQPTLTDLEPELRLENRVEGNPEKVRSDLAENLEGVGMKAGSHFLRNVGRGLELAILSGYVCSALARMDYLGSPERPGTGEEYLEKEGVFRDAAQDLGLGVQELDLAVWASETGEVFK